MRNVAAELELVGTGRGVVQLVAAELPERRNPELVDVDTVLHRRAKSAVLGIADAAGNSLPADRRESVRSAHRIVGKNSIQGQRVLPENGQGAIGGTDAQIAHGIVKLPGTARVGERVLAGERYAGVLGLRVRSVGEMQEIRIEPSLQVEEEIPPGSE